MFKWEFRIEAALQGGEKGVQRGSRERGQDPLKGRSKEKPHGSNEQLTAKSVKPAGLPGGPFTPLYVLVTAAAQNNGVWWRQAPFYTEGHRQYRTGVNEHTSFECRSTHPS